MRWRLRAAYLGIALAILFLGLASRTDVARDLHGSIRSYAGDTLWAMEIFFALALLRPLGSIRGRALAAGVLSFAVELSQLYRAPWLDELRRVPPGSLLLGQGFLASDLVCYAVGIALAAALELRVRSAVLGTIEGSRVET